MVSSENVFDEALLLKILDSGHSRIPVHKPSNRFIAMSAMAYASPVTCRNLNLGK